MARNIYFSDKVRSEQKLYENIIIESLKMYGQDVYYLPREVLNKDKLFLDDVPSRFSDAYKVEMYIENTEAFDNIWGNMDRNIHLEGGSGKHAIENDKKHALDVPLQKDLSVTKAQLEADQAVKQAERALKMARRAQREAKKNAEKSACAN